MKNEKNVNKMNDLKYSGDAAAGCSAGHEDGCDGSTGTGKTVLLYFIFYNFWKIFSKTYLNIS